MLHGISRNDRTRTYILGLLGCDINLIDIDFILVENNMGLTIIVELYGSGNGFETNMGKLKLIAALR